MADHKALRCPYCSHICSSKRGLTQHIKRKPKCSQKQLASLQTKDSGYKTAVEYLGVTEVFGYKRQRYDDSHSAIGPNSATLARRLVDNSSDVLESDDDDFPVNGHQEEDDDGAHVDGVDDTIVNQYADFVNMSRTNLPFTKDQRSAIDLMVLLRGKKTPLNMYETVIEWHFRSAGYLRQHESVSSLPEYISRQRIFSLLYQRYGLANMVNIPKEIILPSSHVKATIVTNNTYWCIQSLLSEPRICDDDYLFFNNNPLSQPPNFKDINEIGDINTGKAYLESYNKLITKPGKQVLLPIIFYTDGTATGQFSDLPITPVKFTLGIFNRKAREKPYLWRTLGYLPKIRKEKARGKRQLFESGHVESLLMEIGDGEGNVSASSVVYAQDFHTMLSVILEDFVKIQNQRFEWDLVYRGKEYQAIEFVPFVPFIKCDTKEADMLAGSYSSRTGNVKQLCRYCCCPTDRTDDPRASFQPKTVPVIANLIKNKDLNGLKLLSQHNIDNACYQLRFGCHNDQGVHGGCPLEMLHAILLGTFKYVRDCFFEQIGENSNMSDEINGLSAEIGFQFGRQSDRDMPVTTFSNGIQKGKLMGKEYTGVLLIIAAILASTKGSSLLTARKKSSTFHTNDGLGDWSMLVETLLMWEEWLKSDVMLKKDVHRSKQKHRYIMYLIRQVGNRRKGMGLKIMKFHGILHMSDDIENFGVPSNFDVEADEGNHKPTKTASLNTRKIKETFDLETSKRMSELHLLDLANQEIKNNLTPWSYYDALDAVVDALGPDSEQPYPPPDPIPPQQQQEEEVLKEVELTGATYYLELDNDGGCPVMLKKNVRRQAKAPIQVEKDFLSFCAQLLRKVEPYVHDFGVRTVLKHNNMLYRGDPLFNGKVWRDWVMINWGGEYGVLPNKIYGFVDLSDVPNEFRIDMGGLTTIAPGIYAIVENATVVSGRNVAGKTELFTPITTEVGRMRDGRVAQLAFYLADVAAFVKPVVVIPNIGGPANSYLMLKSRTEWKEDFVSWLRKPYEQFPDFDDNMEDQINYDDEESLEEE